MILEKSSSKITGKTKENKSKKKSPPEAIIFFNFSFRFVENSLIYCQGLTPIPPWKLSIYGKEGVDSTQDRLYIIGDLGGHLGRHDKVGAKGVTTL